jgi:hypothetical protein
LVLFLGFADQIDRAKVGIISWFCLWVIPVKGIKKAASKGGLWN